MLVQLRNISLPTFVERVFDHLPPVDGDKPWYFDDVEFEIDSAEQLRHLTDLFEAPESLLAYGLSLQQIEIGLWCILGGAHNDAFVSLLWDRSLPIRDRRRLIAALLPLYDRLLASAPYEVIDFEHPDRTPRRFRTIDYMALALVVEAITPANSTAYDRTCVRASLLDVLERLLEHPAPVAQYAALHGLGHLRSKKRLDAIDRYLANPALADSQREYALSARAGTLL